MAKLAIKGHATRGKEVIEILEMLGGKNKQGYNGENIFLWHYINEHGDISIFTHAFDLNECIFFTLKEFLEKFPYKVRDKVYYDNKICDVIEMLWNSNLNAISYGVYDGKNKNLAIVEELKPYKKETMEEKIKIDIPKGYKFTGVDDDNQQVIFEKIGCQYPKTYEECCKVLGKTTSIFFEGLDLEEVNRIKPFIQLLRCRNAYWKIAGEQLGLGKSWNQDYGDRCSIIANNNGNIHTYEYHGCNNVFLAFPTKEMRNAFYENFKDLIEQCKELL